MKVEVGQGMTMDLAGQKSEKALLFLEFQPEPDKPGDFEPDAQKGG